jgi:large subunit ribosomal protein L3
MIGVIAKKVGMSRVFRETGEAVAVTYLEVQPNTVVRTKTKDKDGYDAVVLGVGGTDWKTGNGKELTRYKAQKEWQVESLDGFEKGKTITVEVLPVDSMVTVTGVSKGKGFQGVVKRHGFGGGPGSHGSHFKREPGSIGMRTDPGRVFRGHPMAGHMGLEQVTVKNRAVLVSDVKKNLIGISGPVPGPNGAMVFLTLESAPDAK